MVNKKKFYIPRDLAESYDGTLLRFRISEEDAKNRFLRDSPPPSSAADEEEQTSMRKRDKTAVEEAEENLDVSKRASAQKATVTKEPVTETKTVEVPVTHEEISVERRAC
jgi:stress response protein YsnF